MEQTHVNVACGDGFLRGAHDVHRNLAVAGPEAIDELARMREQVAATCEATSTYSIRQ